MSTLRVNNITNTGGTNVPNPISLTTSYTTLLSGITWSSGVIGTTQLLGTIGSFTSSRTKAIRISVQYTHNGAVNHGYLSGWVFQTGKTYNVDGTYIANSHYDWYYNIFQTDLLIPWDPNGTQSVSMYIVDALNTSASNTYAIYYTGRIDQ